MKRYVAMVIGIGALIGTITPPALYLVHRLDHQTMQHIMLGSCVAWFAAAPFWMKGTER